MLVTIIDIYQWLFVTVLEPHKMPDDEKTKTENFNDGPSYYTCFSFKYLIFYLFSINLMDFGVQVNIHKQTLVSLKPKYILLCVHVFFLFFSTQTNSSKGTKSPLKPYLTLRFSESSCNFLGI